MTRYFLLGVALFSLTTLAQASTGTVRFSGRIVDPGCNASLVLTQQQLRLDGCPLAAVGAEVSVSASSADSVVPSSNVLAAHALTMSTAHSNARVFSQHYRVETLQHQATKSSYLVLINYP